MMDPFQIKYGNVLSGALVLPSLLVDVLWVACTLLGLGKPNQNQKPNQSRPILNGTFESSQSRFGCGFV